MSGAPRVSLKGVGKSYRLYDGPLSKLKQLAWGGLRKFYAEFPAIKGFDLEIAAGETVGIIGHNGAGKSTLLELICGISAPTSGTVAVNGRVISVLELGAGLNREFSGRENIHLYGAVLGMSRREIREKFDAIAAFADVGRFLDQPMRTYSNGMLMRVAFAVASHADAEVFIFDEVLAVGDGSFQHKCFQRLRALKERGATIILVSHNLETVTSFCSRVVVLDHGAKYFDGGPKEGFWAYCRAVSLPPEAGSGPDDAPASGGLKPWDAPMGTGEARLLKAELVDAAGKPRAVFKAGEACDLRFSFRCEREVPRGSYGIVVQNHYALTVYGFNTASDPSAVYRWPAGAVTEGSIRLALNLAPGSYFVSLVLNRVEDGQVVSLCSLESFAELTVTEKAGVFGTSNLYASFTQEPAGPAA